MADSMHLAACPAVPTVPGRRISVVGCSGAGKTTLSRHLAQHLGYRHIELDALYHQPGWQPLATDLFQQSVAVATEGDGWVVEGNYSAVRPQILEQADMVVWLDLPRPTVIRQVLWRTLRRLFRRQTLWNGNRERWTNLFSLKAEESILVWSWTRHAKYRQRYAEEMRNAPAHRHYLRLDSRQAINDFLAKLPTR